MKGLWWLCVLACPLALGGLLRPTGDLGADCGHRRLGPLAIAALQPSARSCQGQTRSPKPCCGEKHPGSHPNFFFPHRWRSSPRLVPQRLLHIQ